MKKTHLVLIATGVIVVVAGLLLVKRGAKSDLRNRRLELDRIAEGLAATIPRERRAALAQVVAGNAADHYRVVESRWQQWQAQDSTFAALDDFLAGPPSAPSTELSELFARESELLAELDAAVRCQGLDWGMADRWRAGEAMQTLHGPAFVAASKLMEARAHAETDGPRALEIGLTTVAIGYDIQQRSTLVAAIVGALFQRAGSRSLARSLARFRLPREQAARLYHRLVAIDAQSPLSFRRLIEVEALGQERHILALGLSEEGSSTDLYGLSASPDLSAPLYSGLFPARAAGAEARAYRQAANRLLAIADLPYPAFANDKAVLERELARSTNLAVAVAMPSLAGYRTQLAGARAAVRAAALLSLAAGELHATGQLPADAEQLVTAAGGTLPADPFTGGTMLYRLEEEGRLAIAFSAGADGQANGARSPELGAVSWLEGGTGYRPGAVSPPVLVGLTLPAAL